MKKLTLLLLVAMTTLTTVSARELGWSYGIKAGANISTYIRKSTDAKAGFVAGVFVENRISNLLGLSAEALYSQQGAKEKGTVHINGIEFTPTASVTDKYDYLNIPILANFYIAKGLALKVGLQPGFNLSAKTNGSTNLGSIEMDLKEDTNSFDMALPIGISCQFNSGLLFDLRYIYSFTNFDKIKEAFDKHSVIQLTAGFRF